MPKAGPRRRRENPRRVWEYRRDRFVRPRPGSPPPAPWPRARRCARPGSGRDFSVHEDAQRDFAAQGEQLSNGGIARSVVDEDDFEWLALQARPRSPRASGATLPASSLTGTTTEIWTESVIRRGCAFRFRARALYRRVAVRNRLVSWFRSSLYCRYRVVSELRNQNDTRNKESLVSLRFRNSRKAVIEMGRILESGQ